VSQEDNFAIPEQNNSNSEQPPSSPTFRSELVSKVVKDICEGRLVFRVDQRGRRPEDIELVSGTVGRFVGYINDYVSGTKAAEEFEFLEKQLFFCISVLRTYDALRPNVNETKLEETLQSLEAKADAITVQLAEVSKAVRESSRQATTKRPARGLPRKNKKKRDGRKS
jgi:hypothetical protein